MGMAERIKERRLAMKYTQEELAEKLGLQKSAIAKYENGRVENIKRSVISKMAEILECSPAYLMGWTVETNYSAQLDSGESMLIECYRNLPIESQKRLEAYASALASMHALEAPLVEAAHKRTDIISPEGIDTSDDDIMTDDNF